MAINTDTVVQDIFTVWATQAGPTNWQWDDLSKLKRHKAVGSHHQRPDARHAQIGPDLCIAHPEDFHHGD